MALNKLRSLPVQVYVSDGVIIGRIELDPSRLAAMDGLALKREQAFIVQHHDQIQFIPPSPLTHLGQVPYFDVQSADELRVRVESSWTDAVRRARGVLQLVRVFAPSARMHPDTWTIEAQVADTHGPVHLSFHGDGGFFRVAAVDGEALGDADDWSRGIRPIDLVADPQLVERALLNEIRGARRRLLNKRAAQGEDVFVDLGEYGVPDAAPSVQAVVPRLPEPYDSAWVEDPRGEGPTADFDDPFVDPTPGLCESESPIVPPPLPFTDAEVSDFELRIEDVVELAPTVEGRCNLENRPRRLMIAEQARLHIGGQTFSVEVAQVTAGGAFVRLPFEHAPEPGEIVILGGFGPRSISARVAHRRGAAEAEAVGTPEGIGLAWLEPGDDATGIAAFQEAPFALIVMKDGPARERAVSTMVREGFQIIVAENLVAASASFYHYDLSLVLIDDTINDGQWELVGESLDFSRRPVPVILVQRDTVHAVPDWARAVPVEELDGRVVEDVLSRPRNGACG